MSPYEIYYRGGSVEHYNEEAGIVWLRRLRDHFPHLVWINPNAEYTWDFHESTAIIREFTGNRMFPMPVDGLGRAMKCLKNPKLVYKNQVGSPDE